MRDIALMSVILVLAAVALRRPWIGVLLWLWVSLMNPHRYTYGFAYDAPVAMIAALATLLGLLFTRERESPFKGPAVTLFVIFTAWVTLTWLAGRDPWEQLPQWEKIVKVNLMVLVCLALFRTKEQIFCLAWVLTMSIGLLSIKGGAFTLVNAGNYRVWGPPGSWVEGNNEFAVATIMVIPLLRFLQLQVTQRWLSWMLLGGMALCAASALGSHSRGALLALVAMTIVIWWRGNNRLRDGVVLGVVAALALAAMPEHWIQRMETIETYGEDASALGRFSAWWVSWNLALSHPLGIGLSITYPPIFEQYSPYGLRFGTPVAHSIWFQVLGHHGFIGLALFTGIWVATWFGADGLRRHARHRPEHRWVGDLGGMAQVSIAGYAVGGAFLQLAYYDFPYYVMVLVALARMWVLREAWRTEPTRGGVWRNLIGLGAASPSSPSGSAGAGPEAGSGDVPGAAPARPQPALPGHPAPPQQAARHPR